MAHDHEDLQVGWMNNARFFLGHLYETSGISGESNRFFSHQQAT